MKKYGSRYLAAGAAMTLLLAGCGGGDSAGGGSEGETITLRAATGLSAQHAWWEASMVPWMERVEELTDGQVQFETFTGGELVSVPDEGDALQSGTVDVALVLPIYQPDQFPMAEVTMLPLNHSDTLIASNAWKKLLESEEELADGQTYTEMQFGDFKVFPVSTTQEYSISTTGHEFNSVSDVEGTSLRTPSRIHEMYAAKTGINSVTMPAVEIYDALSRGTFEGAFYSIADWTGYGFQDLFRYTVTGINFGHFNAFIGMSQSRWDELPENVQEAMTQANEDIFEAGAQEWMDRAEAIIPENEENGGKFVDFSELDQEVQDHFNTGIEDTWTDYAQLLEDNGLPGNEVVKMWRDLLIEEGGEVPEAVMNLE
ncbi:TRAP transporter [Planococcus plakortidis]|uniref:TRAP transporter n=1 Tax=Planococcus plakortidis TaxID=1038856 RepID=A0A1C7E9G5_9BACL|nr:TRAP transporter substrate-binding protein DctP [Planococcus plakortidis]ANU20369.1 TRAP transporter [Planococcus plakortidis]